jgi:hypothetical protein
MFKVVGRFIVIIYEGCATRYLSRHLLFRGSCAVLLTLESVLYEGGGF